MLTMLTPPAPAARYLFLFDKVVIVCKRRGYSYELKEIIELLFHKMTDDPMNNKDVKKVGPVLGDGGAAGRTGREPGDAPLRGVAEWPPERVGCRGTGLPVNHPLSR